MDAIEFILRDNMTLTPEQMREYLVVARNNELAEPEVRKVINDVRRAFGGATRAA